ncbi:MAG: PASTA domain-containing protein [Taibaiella sp.]|nr:PASTA domain-containing protein [Taibaiella sp.]
MEDRIKKSFWFNLLMVATVFTVIYVIFFLALSFLTHHGEEVVIPNLRGKYLDMAITQLHEMHFEVQIDSTFDPSAKPLTVLKQVPDTGSIVKTGRIVMITVNSITALRVPMPNLISLSYRSAEMLLKNNKMFVGDTTYVPDIARGAIKEQLYKGLPIRAGEMIPQGSRIGLVIGNGLGNTEFDVPDVTRLTIDEALAIINQYSLTPNMYVGQMDGEITDTFSAYIIDQSPKPYSSTGERNKIKMGSVIDLSIKQHPEPGDYEAGTGNNSTDKSVKPQSDKDNQ